jgi:glycolate oxidase
MEMPAPDPASSPARGEIVARLRAACRPRPVIDEPHETRAYECDALTAYRCPPLASCCPPRPRRSRPSCASATRSASPWCPAAPGTSLAGGSLPTPMRWCWAWRG